MMKKVEIMKIWVDDWGNLYAKVYSEQLPPSIGPEYIWRYTVETRKSGEALCGRVETEKKAIERVESLLKKQGWTVTKNKIDATIVT